MRLWIFMVPVGFVMQGIFGQKGMNRIFLWMFVVQGAIIPLTFAALEFVMVFSMVLGIVGALASFLPFFLLQVRLLLACFMELGILLPIFVVSKWFLGMMFFVLREVVPIFLVLFAMLLISAFPMTSWPSWRRRRRSRRTGCSGSSTPPSRWRAMSTWSSSAIAWAPTVR